MIVFRYPQIAAATLIVAAVSVFGQVTLDGTVGSSGALPGPSYNIPASLGRTVGNNLFHSFGEFNLVKGESATFTGPDGIANVISRVTGGHASSIDGTISCTIPDANFFFINPFGVVFGQHAQVNVGGSFVVSTADYVKLADGGRFDARNPANDILTMAPVSAFGFRGPAVSPIQVNGPSPEEPSSMLAQVGGGKTIAIIGGDIQIHNTQLMAPDGRVALIGVASSGELAFDADDLSSPVSTASFTKLGNLELSDYAFMDVSGNSGGRIFLQADDVTLANGAVLYAAGYDIGNGLGINIVGRHSINILESTIYTFAFGSGNGGDINLLASLVRIDGQGNGATVSSDTFWSGKAGNIHITADTFELLNSGAISATSSGPGNGGDIQITASTVRLDGEGVTARIGTEAFSDAGKAGNIYITTDTLTLNNYAIITSATWNLFDGGSVNINAKALAITKDSIISATTFADGRGGNIEITADAVLLDRVGSIGTEFGVIAGTAGTGNGGDIVITTGTLDLRNGAQVTASALEPSSGNAGNVSVQANTVALNSESSVESAAIGTGKGGNVTIQADNSVLLQNHARVSVSSVQNDGGEIRISAGNEIHLDQGLISAQAHNNGGNVFLTTPSLVYLLKSQITATAVNGNGGNITIDPLFVILDRSSLGASAIQGNGGNVSIVSDYFLQSGSVIDVSSQFGVQGNVTITAPDVDFAGNVQALPADLLSAEMELLPYCALRLPVGVSSFFVRSSRSRPVSPGMLMPVISSVGEGDGK